jgi:predicted N-acetyltransferase YhbS
MPDPTRRPRSDFLVRKANPDDLPQIHKLLDAAFGIAEGQEIGALVDELLVDPTAEPLVSLVVTQDDRIVGHVVFSAVRVGGQAEGLESAILAPLAVHPEVQGLGLGGRLVAEGIARLRAAGTALVFVLGHPGYYPRHGFVPAGEHGLDAPYPIQPEHADAWMVRALRPDTIGRITGTVHCADALDHPKYWVES